ncbi:hypothetical protein HY969_02475 [Candidatus Kaiserbacteria bacterium]|nr:hypothetical protein [Candidatus Kaiserbacteria bacterium]
MTIPPVCIFLDLEYCYPGMGEGAGRPTAADQRQIVQIAAIKYDTIECKELGALDLLVKPLFTPRVPIFFEKLTGISQVDIDARGIDLVNALKHLEQFCEGISIVTFNQDWYVIGQNYGYLELPNPFSEFIRVKALLPGWGVDPDKYSSGTLHQAVGITMDGHVHNALHDVRSMSLAVSVLSRNHQNDR